MARWGGKTDDEELIDLTKWIAQNFKICPTHIWRDHLLLIDRTDGRHWVLDHLDTPEPPEGCIMHRPDIIIQTTEFVKDILIIEVDGSIHQWKHVKRKTAKRNLHYADYKIPHIILDKADLKSINLTVKEALDVELPKYLKRAR